MTESGVPRNQNLTVDSTGRKVLFDRGLSRHLIIVTDQPMKLYMTQEDFDADVNSFLVGIGTFSEDMKARGIYLKATGATATVTLRIAYVH